MHRKCFMYSTSPRMLQTILHIYSFRIPSPTAFPSIAPIHEIKHGQTQPCGYEHSTTIKCIPKSTGPRLIHDSQAGLEGSGWNLLSGIEAVGEEKLKIRYVGRFPRSFWAQRDSLSCKIFRELKAHKARVAAMAKASRCRSIIHRWLQTLW